LDEPIILAVTGAVLFLGGLVTNSLWPPVAPSLDLEIDDNEIRAVWNRKVIRTVRRDRVRYVREWSGVFGTRLVVSEHGPVATRFLGYIPVPKRLLEAEQYERIKAQALGWMASSER
jgi:hypothetical protein